MIFQTIIEGIAYGIFLSILVGPLLVTLIDTSINHGIKKGLIVASGIWLSDLLFIIAVIFLSLTYQDVLNSSYLSYGAIIASVSFIAVGIQYLMTKDTALKAYDITWKNNFSYQFIKGFLINTINPFTLVFWTSLAANKAILQDQPEKHLWIFFCTIFIIIIFTDTLKVILANKIAFWLKPSVTLYLRLFSGLVFIVSGLYILGKFVMKIL